VSDDFRSTSTRARMRRSFGRSAAPTYDAAAVLQKPGCATSCSSGSISSVSSPALVLDLGAGTGHASLALKRRYRSSQVVALDLAEGMLREAGRRQTLLRRFQRVCAHAAALPLRDGSVDLVVSNLMLQWCNDPGSPSSASAAAC
jgi:malonyl-CoA O-methyltransferase